MLTRTSIRTALQNGSSIKKITITKRVYRNLQQFLQLAMLKGVGLKLICKQMKLEQCTDDGPPQKKKYNTEKQKRVKTT